MGHPNGAPILMLRTGVSPGNFQVLKDMVKSGVHEPDEILYNSLLDGCAKQHRVAPPAPPPVVGR